MEKKTSIPEERTNRLALQVRAGKYNWIAKTVDEITKNRSKMLEFKSECDVDGISVSEAIAEALFAVETERAWGKKGTKRPMTRALTKDEPKIEAAINALVEASDSPIFEQIDFSTAFESLILKRTGKTRVQFYAERLLDIAQQGDDHRAGLTALDRAREMSGKREVKETAKEARLTFISYHDNRQQIIKQEGIIEGEFEEDGRLPKDMLQG